MRKLSQILIALIILSFSYTNSWAENSNERQISLTEAIQLSVKNSKSLKNTVLEIDKSKEERENAADEVDFTPGGGDAPNSEAEAAWYSLLSEDLGWQMSKRSYTTEEDRLVLSVCQKYWNVQKSIDIVKDKELSVTLAELSFNRAQAMVRLGMIPPEYSGMSPDGALAVAQGSLNSSKSDLENAKNKLSSDYEALNQLLGLNTKERPQLTEEIKFEPLPDTDLEYAVQQVIENSPLIWLAEEKINLAKYAYEMMWASGQYTPYEVRKIEKQQAELDAASAKDATALATRGLYYTVRNLEATRPVLEKSVVAAEEALRVAKLQYELGMITRENLIKAECSLANAKQALLELTQQHAYAKLAFEKPWAVSTGS